MIFLFELHYADGWDVFYSKMDSSEKQRIWKKIQQLKALETARHLKRGLPYFVVESGQCRIAFKEEGKKRTVYFAGNHKQYEKWCRTQEQTLR
ncbi:MAG: hypothetical protein HYW50_04655 [Candidatus Diapherotrites archaeon]|nr:hypothetical protein [Candidatus Diapherotrites archaeon]